ncbi:uncharacterized protein LOC144628718 [Oculina patagonica]
MSIEWQAGDVSPLRNPLTKQEMEKKTKPKRKSAPKKSTPPKKLKIPKVEVKEEVLEEGEIFDPDNFLTQTFNMKEPHCHIHKEDALVKRTSDGGWQYYFCPHVTDGTICFVCCGVDNIEKYLVEIIKQLPAYYYWNMEKMSCYCNESLILSMSKSEKNPDRLYLKCRKGKCRFFQWADKVPFGKIKAWLEGKVYAGNEDPMYSRKTGLDTRDEQGYPKQGYDMVDRPTPPLAYDEELGKRCQEDKFWLDEEGKIVMPQELRGMKYEVDKDKALRNQLYLRRISQKQYPHYSSVDPLA